MSKRTRLWLARIFGALAVLSFLVMIGIVAQGALRPGPAWLRADLGACGIAFLWWGWRYMWPHIAEDWRGRRG